MINLKEMDHVDPIVIMFGAKQKTHVAQFYYLVLYSTIRHMMRHPE